MRGVSVKILFGVAAALFGMQFVVPCAVYAGADGYLTPAECRAIDANGAKQWSRGDYKNGEQLVQVSSGNSFAASRFDDAVKENIIKSFDYSDKSQNIYYNDQPIPSSERPYVKQMNGGSTVTTTPAVKAIPSTACKLADTYGVKINPKTMGELNTALISLTSLTTGDFKKTIGENNHIVTFAWQDTDINNKIVSHTCAIFYSGDKAISGKMTRSEYIKVAGTGNYKLEETSADLIVKDVNGQLVLDEAQVRSMGLYSAG
ncbi:MAG: hypothetical protein WCY10_02840 [Candidatus Omnitrophota bacterium]